MKVSCIILNYNDSTTTEKLVQLIKDYDELDSIVLVDNCSTDNSATVLERLEGGKVHFIPADRNGGYGYGNNLGIRYAYERLQATHVLVANPDVEVSQECIRALMKTFQQVEGCGVAAPMTKGPDGKTQLSSWKLMGLAGDLLDTGIITRRLFKRWLTDRPLVVDSGVSYVDAVPGSLFMADCAVLMDCGLYDENVFLYYEEKILGFKLRSKGYKTVLLQNQSYIHHHSVSIDKNVKSILKKQALLHESKLYYYIHYLKINRLQVWLTKAFLGFLMGEIWFLTEILGMTW